MFLLPFGRFLYCRAPMALASSGDWFNQRTDAIFEGIDVQKEVDDILIEGENPQELLGKIMKVLQRCKENHVNVSLKKFQAGRQVTFAGFQVMIVG